MITARSITDCCELQNWCEQKPSSQWPLQTGMITRSRETLFKRGLSVYSVKQFTTWLQAIWHRGLKGNQCFIGLCPWDSATLPYKGACRESPLRQTFSFDSMRRSPEEKRRHELERARLYRGKSKAENRPLSRPIREAHNEAHRESRRRDTPKLRRKRLARKHECSWPGCRRCMSCGEEGHYIRTCPQGARLTNNKCSKCRQPGHRADLCESTCGLQEDIKSLDCREPLGSLENGIIAHTAHMRLVNDGSERNQGRETTLEDEDSLMWDVDSIVTKTSQLSLGEFSFSLNLVRK